MIFKGMPQLRYLLLGLILLFFAIFLFSYSDNIIYSVKTLRLDDNSSGFNQFDHWKGMGENYRNCLIENIGRRPDNLYDILSGSVAYCLKHIKLPSASSWRSWGPDFKMETLTNVEGDRKLVLLSDSDHCVTVTIGIGHDTGCEEGLKVLKPNCLFYGADPVYDAGIVYERVGKYFHIGVGEKNGALRGQLKSGLGNTDYKLSQNITGVSLDNFLKNYVKKKFIDYLWIDNEGPEFRMIELLQRKGPVSRIWEICQLNVEWHVGEKGQMNLDLNDETVKSFKPKYHNFIKNTPYLPLLADTRTFYFNFDSVACFNKFFVQYYK